MSSITSALATNFNSLRVGSKPWMGVLPVTYPHSSRSLDPEPVQGFSTGFGWKMDVSSDTDEVAQGGEGGEGWRDLLNYEDAEGRGGGLRRRSSEVVDGSVE